MSRPNTITNRKWAAFVKAAGGVGKVAKKLAVEPVQVYRWSHEVNSPNETYAKRIRQIARKLGVPSPIGESVA